MKIKLLHLFGLIMVLSSCSSAYRIGQTPDDVYFSPAPQTPGDATSDSQEDKEGYGNNGGTRADQDVNLNRVDPDYGGVSFDAGSAYYPGNYCGSLFFSSFNAAYYDPLYTGVTFYPDSYGSYLFSPCCNSYGWAKLYHRPPGNRAGNYLAPRKYNLVAYRSNLNRLSLAPEPGNNPSRTLNKPPATTGFGNFIRRIFILPADAATNHNDRNGNNSAPTRTFEPGSSSRGSSGGGGATRTFRH